MEVEAHIELKAKKMRRWKKRYSLVLHSCQAHKWSIHTKDFMHTQDTQYLTDNIHDFDSMAYPHYRSQFGDTTFTKVFVGGLAWETHTEEMHKYFEQFGEILEAVIITDKNTGKSKGYGFVSTSLASSPHCNNNILIWPNSYMMRLFLHLLGDFSWPWIGKEGLCWSKPCDWWAESQL